MEIGNSLTRWPGPFGLLTGGDILRMFSVRAMVSSGGISAIIDGMSALNEIGEAPVSLERIVRRLFWWKSPEEALADPIRFVSQVMTFGTWDDIQIALAEYGDDTFRAALDSPPAGVFDARSWNYWHLVFGRTPVPPLPQRTLEP